MKDLSLLFALGVCGLIVAIISAFSQGPAITGKVIAQAQAPEGFSAPFYESTQIVDIIVTNNGDSFDANVQIDVPNGYVYETAYYLSGGKWNPITIPNAAQSWASGTVNAQITDIYNNHVLTDEDEFVVAVYACPAYDDGWKCGCSTPDNSCNKWMLQSQDLGDKHASGKYLDTLPTRTDATLNQEFSIAIDIKEGQDVYAYDFDIEYDEEVLEFVSVSHADYLGVNGYPPNQNSPDFLCVDPKEEQGAIRAIACTHVGSDLSNGDGTLATLTFKPIKRGYSQIRIFQSEVAKWTNVGDKDDLLVEDYAVNNAFVVVN